MKKILSFILLAILSATPLWAQFETANSEMTGFGSTTGNLNNRTGKPDSLGTDKEIPEGIHV